MFLNIYVAISKIKNKTWKLYTNMSKNAPKRSTLDGASEKALLKGFL